MRITAGQLRGRIVTVPDIPGVRPTPSKVRQALFNILGSVDGCDILDLFSGSGLMAVEALSRGAASVISIEKDRRIVGGLNAMRRQFDLEKQWQLICGDAERSLGQLQGRRFDLIFADPPYARGISEVIPGWLNDAGIACGQLVIEEQSRVDPLWPTGWTELQARRYGGTCLHFLGMEDA